VFVSNALFVICVFFSRGQLKCLVLGYIFLIVGTRLGALLIIISTIFNIPQQYSNALI
jgi:hypothetical protein